MSFRHSIRNFDKGLMGKMSRSPDFVKICQITLFLNRIKASWKTNVYYHQIECSFCDISISTKWGKGH